MKTLLTALLITLSFDALADDNIIQQQMKLQQNLMLERPEESREQYLQPYYNQPYQGNQGYYNQSYYGNQLSR
jgi:hypothetical protein